MTKKETRFEITVLKDEGATLPTITLRQSYNMDNYCYYLSDNNTCIEIKKWENHSFVTVFLYRLDEKETFKIEEFKKILINKEK